MTKHATHKIPAPGHVNARKDELFEVALYLVLVYEGFHARSHTSTQLRGLSQHPRRAVRETDLPEQRAETVGVPGVR